MARRPAIRIGKHQDLELLVHLPNRRCQIVDLVAAIECASCANDVHGTFACRSDSLEHSIGRILRSGNWEKNLVLRVIKMSQGKEIRFQVIFYSLYGADQGYPRRIEASSGAQTPPSHFQPFQPLPETIGALQDLLEQ